MTLVRLRTLALLGCMLASPMLAAGADFLTGPQSGEPLELASSFVRAHASDYGLDAADLADFEVTDHYRSQHNGVNHIYLRQRHQGVPVFNGVIHINVTRDGAILNMGSRFVAGLASRVDAIAPRISQEAAILGAAEHFGLPALEEALVHLETIGGPTMAARFEDSSISRDEMEVSLMYQPIESGAVRLAWRLVVNSPASSDWWDVRVDATTGEVIGKNNWTAHVTEGLVTEACDVIPLPAESPNDTGMSQVTAIEPADATASEFGWHDDDGVDGAEYTDTRGNNVWAQEDLDANNVGGMRPDGGAGLVFDYLWDPALDPEAGTNVEASIVNLFYYNNIMHDVSYHYGFTEVAGNFQENNYDNGGLGGDPVNADALDGSGTDNANFATPGDGARPRMQMYRFLDPFGQRVTVNSPASITGEYAANPSNNGGTANGLTADLAIVEDGVAPTTDACETVTNDLTGKIALILWNQGQCNSSVFVANAQAAGAVAAIIIDNTDEPRTNFGGSPAIPSVAVGLSDGLLFVDTITSGGMTVNTTIDDSPGSVDRDSDFDNGIMGHEYGHGISNRLIGGPSNTGCFFGGERMGEGLSDFWTIVLSPMATDTPSTQRGVGTFTSFEQRDGFGIRSFPYSTDMAVNPQTFADIETAVQPHGVGSIWMTMAHEIYWELIARYGLDMDLYAGTGGNNLFIQLVVDAMKLVGCGPTFETLRDAMLIADDVETGDGSLGSGLNQCEIWRGFAKRGLGELAASGTVNVGDEVEDFTVPASCSPLTNYIFDNGFESGDVSAWSSSSP